MAQVVQTPHITQYVILKEPTPEALNDVVARAIHKGWQPYGTLTVEPPRADNDNTWFLQPIVRYAGFSR